MTAGAKENSYYWNGSRTEVNFDILELKDGYSPCYASDGCTLIFFSSGKVWPFPSNSKTNGWTKFKVLCELRTPANRPVDKPKDKYQLLKEQLKKEAQVRQESIKVLEAQMEKEAQVRQYSMKALEVQMQKMNVQIKEETEKVRNELKAQMKKEAQNREDSTYWMFR